MAGSFSTPGAADLAPVNVMIAGQAGVGKSTLINAVLRKRVADVGVGEPVTAHIQAHGVPGVPITVYDTPGLELGENVESVAEEFWMSSARSATCLPRSTSTCCGSASLPKARA